MLSTTYEQKQKVTEDFTLFNNNDSTFEKCYIEKYFRDYTQGYSQDYFDNSNELNSNSLNLNNSNNLSCYVDVEPDSSLNNSKVVDPILPPSSYLGMASGSKGEEEYSNKNSKEKNNYTTSNDTTSEEDNVINNCISIMTLPMASTIATTNVFQHPRYHQASALSNNQ